MKRALVLVFCAGLLSAFNVCITNDNFDMVTCKKICAHLSFDPEESALYRDTLCISVDSPDIVLKGWRTAAQAPITYTAGFKKTKRLFIEPFNLEILIDFDRQVVFDKLHLSVSSLVLTKEGNNKAENVVVALQSAKSALDSRLPAKIPMAQAPSALVPSYQKSFEIFNRNKKIFDKNEINDVLIIDRLKGLWHELHLKMGQVTSSFSFYKWYFVLWLFFVLLVLGWFYPRFRIPLSGRWLRELFMFIVLLLFVLTWWLFRGRIAASFWYGTLSALCVPGSLYYLWGGTETFLDRFKVLIGIILAVMLLPLLAFACMHGNFELLKFFL